MHRQFESKNRFLANNSLINSDWYCRLFDSNESDTHGPFSWWHWLPCSIRQCDSFPNK